MSALAGRVAIVTGAAGGIGRETAVRFAAAGAAVTLADRDRAGAEAAAQRIVAAGGQAIAVATDVTSDDAVAAMVAVTVERFGRLDFAFNNAGIAPPGAPLAEVSDADWHRALAINLTGVFLCMKHEIPAMLTTGDGGAVINTSSVMGQVSGPGLAAYSASKSGVIGLTRAAAIDYAARAITVNALCPGGIMGTGITDDPANRDHMEQLRMMTPRQRLGAPGDIAEAVLWLCSPGARFLTGQAIAIDGGYCAL